MNNKSKVIVLSLVFILPVATFLFLKFFGENKFEIPVLKDSDSVIKCDSLISNSLTNQIDVVFLKRIGCERANCSIEIDQLKRVAQRYKNEERISYSIISADKIDLKWNFKNLSAYTYDSDISLDCLELENTNYFLLFDSKNQLRGAYEIERNEVDRLIIELDILNRY